MARLLQPQQPSIEALARNIVERPAAQMMQSAGAAAMQAQVPPSKRDAVLSRSTPTSASSSTRPRRCWPSAPSKLAPSVYGAQMEERFSEDELKG